MQQFTPVDRQAVHAEMERARETFHALLDSAGPEDLRRRSAGTRWTNEQLLFHMLFGYLIVRALLILMRVVSLLPRPWRRGFAGLLNASKSPFDVVNYWGSCLGAKVFDHRRMGKRLDRVIGSLHRRLDADGEAELRRAMLCPDRWDPFFAETMSRVDLYRYATQHFDFHRGQLTLTVR
jgi:hypothetical protein